jgi:hypothetical protein
MLMTVMGVLLLVGITLTLWWAGTEYETWEPGDGGDAVRSDTDLTRAPRPALGIVALRYLRGVAIALVGGFWAGALVTGPAVRIIMRLLAVTAGDAAQGRITEADEVVGKINLDGTIGLYLFGGILPALLSGGIYLVVRRWLPSGFLCGVTFGALHLVFAATRIDPLRPGNPDFDLVGPGWLSVVTFGLAAIFHGMAVVAIANRYSHAIPAHASGRAGRLRAILPVIPPALLLVPFFPVLVVPALGLGITLVASQIGVVVQAVRSRAALIAGRVAISVVAVAVLPSTLTDLREVIVRDDEVTLSTTRCEMLERPTQLIADRRGTAGSKRPESRWPERGRHRLSVGLQRVEVEGGGEGDSNPWPSRSRDGATLRPTRSSAEAPSP